MKDRLRLSIQLILNKKQQLILNSVATKSKIVSIVVSIIPFRMWEPWDSPTKVQFPSSKNSNADALSLDSLLLQIEMALGIWWGEMLCHTPTIMNISYNP